MSHFGKLINNNKDNIIILSKGEPGNEIYGDSDPAFSRHL